MNGALTGGLAQQSSLDIWANTVDLQLLSYLCLFLLWRKLTNERRECPHVAFDDEFWFAQILCVKGN